MCLFTLRNCEISKLKTGVVYVTITIFIIVEEDAKQRSKYEKNNTNPFGRFDQ